MSIEIVTEIGETMQREEFIDYLTQVRGLKKNTAQTRAGNCATIEEFEGDLDRQFREDGLNSLLERMRYSVDDHRSNRPARHSVPINGNIYTGTATLKRALKLYISFKRGDSTPSGRTGAKRCQLPSCNRRNSSNSDWPKWEQPDEGDSLILAKMVAKYTKFLAPEIIEVIVRDNEAKGLEWIEGLAERGIGPELYLWSGSPCVFPGVRRHAGSKEINQLRDANLDNSDISDALCIDDNDYPRQIWSFVFRGAQFSKKGPEGYRLAHLIDHKEYKNRMSEELDCSLADYPDSLPGLYTCASNSAYVSGGLLLPTDFNAKVRNFLQRRALQLYGSVCNILPEGLSVKECDDPEWDLERFDWAPCVGTLENMDAFLRFREARMEKLFRQSLATS